MHFYEDSWRFHGNAGRDAVTGRCRQSASVLVAHWIQAQILHAVLRPRAIAAGKIGAVNMAHNRYATNWSAVDPCWPSKAWAMNHHQIPLPRP
ncbi:hypothetical protein [Acidovorax sp. A1169]|uniref:hypothetical protein n=1 Tax=Acidovorax sp. A1169 TaxID=3059524 RepID=UPI002737A4E2|nr:hypothetical protein [Acidovorax sp. A1169]MDP4078998.1 hypothetical protein [Acidovorax sp. A1169]